MEIFLFFAAMGIFFLVIFVREAWLARKKEQQFTQFLYEHYGEIPHKEYSLERFARMGSYYERHVPEYGIDDITWNDLGMDALFKRMDYTFSASGEEYLYYTLRNICFREQELNHLEEVVNFFAEHADERVKVQLLMKELGHLGKYSLYDYLDNLEQLGTRSNARAIICNGLFLPCLAMLPFAPTPGIMGIVILMLYNLLTYFKEKREIEPYITSFAYILRLVAVCEKLVDIPVAVCREEWEAIKNCRRKLQTVNRGSFWVLSGNGSASTGSPIDIFLDYIRMIFHVDLIQFNRMLLELRRHRKEIDELITRTGYIETAIAIGAYRASLQGWCVPRFRTEREMQLTDAWHPLLIHPVKNSITAKRGVLLTGSNASGKSTFLKTVALNAIMAQTIHTCTAACYSAPFYRIYSSMTLRDSVENGESYYMAEIRSLKRILDAGKVAGSPILCFVDEVLRGTNTVERIAAATQILKSLEEGLGLCFAATHDVEMTDLLTDCYDNYHFEEEIRQGDIFFNYQLLPGRAATRNAIRLLELMGYEDDMIRKATERAEHFLKTGVWVS